MKILVHFVHLLQKSLQLCEMFCIAYAPDTNEYLLIGYTSFGHFWFSCSLSRSVHRRYLMSTKNVIHNSYIYFIQIIAKSIQKFISNNKHRRQSVLPAVEKMKLLHREETTSMEKEAPINSNQVSSAIAIFLIINILSVYHQLYGIGVYTYYL